MSYQLLTTSHAIAQFCQQASQADYIAVDTEFVRTRTLYPKLGLVQVYDGQDLVLIDPIADVDLAPLKALLANSNVTKVLHSCSEDLETFATFFGEMPNCIFDTQTALALLNKGNSIGYARMVADFLDIELDKGESRTDWVKRPLTQSQLAYASNDVLYLYQIYPQILAQVQQANKTQWVFDEVELTKQKKSSQLPTRYTYLSIKNAWRLNQRQLAVLQKLAQWRQETAQQRNLALNFVVRENNLYEVARRLVRKKSDLFGIDTFAPQEIRRYGDTMVALVDEALHEEEAKWPNRVRRVTDFPAYKGTSKQIRAICESVAQEIDVPLELLASRKQINQLIKWFWMDIDETRLSGLQPDLLEGWRKAVVSDQLLPLFDDNISPNS